jgi:hypothetical protein
LNIVAEAWPWSWLPDWVGHRLAGRQFRKWIPELSAGLLLFAERNFMPVDPADVGEENPGMLCHLRNLPPDLSNATKRIIARAKEDEIVEVTRLRKLVFAEVQKV